MWVRLRPDRAAAGASRPSAWRCRGARCLHGRCWTWLAAALPSSCAANVSFVEADAQTYAFAPASFDAVFSRFGVMFFADPPAAFANIRRALKPGGRLVFVCWRTPAEELLPGAAV